MKGFECQSILKNWVKNCVKNWSVYHVEAHVCAIQYPIWDAIFIKTIFLESTKFSLILSEDGKPKYNCDLCGKSYIRSWSYYGHMREHASGEKQHKCEVCGKVFNYASNLRQHMLIHTGT